jgi:hypothetical protein
MLHSSSVSQQQQQQQSAWPSASASAAAEATFWLSSVSMALLLSSNARSDAALPFQAVEFGNHS